MSSREHTLALLTLERMPGLGPAGIRTLLEQEPDARAALGSYQKRVSADIASRASTEAEGTLSSMALLARLRPELAPRVLTSGSAEYPAGLMDLSDPPPTLFAMGKLNALDRPCVAIVGTRRASRYGERITRGLAGTLAGAGACVISGMAAGIDGMAHSSALEAEGAGGRTVAVLGTGIDIPYPAAHRSLHERIATSGLLLSELPPGERGGPGSFPRRNRIIAALAQLTIVVEAGARSGALITAAHALDLGRMVAAVPGPIDAPESVGSNALIRDGAHVIADVTDALALMGLTPPPRRAGPDLSGDARKVYDALQSGTVRVDDLPTRAALPVERCLAAITELEVAGTVVCDLTGEVSRRI